MLYEVDGQKLEVVITKKNNKNTYIRIKEDMKIYVKNKLDSWSIKLYPERNTFYVERKYIFSAYTGRIFYVIKFLWMQSNFILFFVLKYLLYLVFLVF